MTETKHFIKITILQGVYFKISNLKNVIICDHYEMTNLLCDDCKNDKSTGGSFESDNNNHLKRTTTRMNI